MVNNFFNFNKDLVDISFNCEKECKDIFESIDAVENYNQCKILSAFIKNKVTETDFAGSTGYGYGDKGREKLDKIFADIFNTEDAIVRHNFVCGTHALAVTLFALLRPKDKLVAITGEPYDTLREVIGISNNGKNKGSLKDFGIVYDEIDLTDTRLELNIEDVAKKVKDAKVVYIQRSKGYSLRKSLAIEDIKKMISKVKLINESAIILVDNCYGEFVEKKEPTDIGADLIVGSLIKNPGGGIAKTGGYIAGKSKLIELCGARLTAPGIGREVGCTFGELRNMFLGLFLSPQATANALKTSIFASKLFENMGYEVYPKFNEKRSDIIQAIRFNSPQKVIAFCQGIQKGSPIDSFITPVPWDMPGYSNKVIMAAGTFTMGASIELSADAPIREPFAVWLQGGLTYNSGKIGVMLAAQEVKKID